MKRKQSEAKINLSLFSLLLFLLLGFSSGYAQCVKTDSLTSKKYASVDVPKTYERIIAKGYESLEMFDYLGHYYYKVNDLEKAKTYFDLLFKKYPIAKISQTSIEVYRKIHEIEKSKKFITALE
ncbi:hypothetical protein [Flavobacterium sp. UMI-01]|uniref:hypothetical protein n=1 Tax=Flavobacterium sp. UMI-01 TaxID=1441053 RepID=UPI001C7D28BF|nr:hypothetical protein [Flavobacterium sp. UMI-01]GIZ08226.1 hypothetical protein FUMI01_09530 [Flavobacterium sp. UMI-01]